VTISSALAALSAGLDRDEQLARAADDLQCDSGWGMHRTQGTLGFTISPHIGHIHEVEAAEHIVRNGPDRVLRHVEAIQQVLTIVRHQTLLFDSARDRADAERHAFEQGFQAAAGLFIEALAKGYTEDTSETETP